MILRAFRFAGYSFALTIVLAGLADAAGSALGGSQQDVVFASCLLVLALGAGMVRPGPCGSLHLMSAVALGLSAWILPTLPRFVASALLLGSVLPLAIVGRRFGQALAGVGPGSPALLVGLFFGLIAAGFGTGPWLYLLMVVGILWPPPAAGEQDDQAPSAPAVDRIALFLISFAAGMLWITMRPMATVLDSENVLQDTRRAVTVAMAFGLGWWTLGAAFADMKAVRWLAGGGAAALAAIGLNRTTLTSARLASPEEFAPLVGSDRLLQLLDRNTRLTEIDDLYVPWLTLVLTAFPVIAIAASLRIAAGSNAQDARWPVRLGLMLIGLASGVLVTQVVALPSLADSLPAVTFAVLLVAAAALALGQGTRLGAPVGLALALGTWFVVGTPETPLTGRPFYDLHQYEIADNESGARAQRTTSSSYARVIERQTPTLPGSYQLHDGRNRLTPDWDESPAWEMDALFPLLFGSSVPQRTLLVGAPHGPTLASLRELGVQEAHLAVDPPELAEIAWGFTPEWAGLTFDGLSSTPARADGEFDYVLLREAGTWDPQRARSFRPAAIRQLAGRVAPGGMAAVLLDPRRSIPGLTGEVATHLGNALGAEAQVYLIPHSFFTPTIAIVAQRAESEDQAAAISQAQREAHAFRMRALLRERGLPLNAQGDLGLLRMDTSEDESRLFSNLLGGPLPPLALGLSATAPFRGEESRPRKRASSVLARLGAEGSLTWVFGLHENAQLWSLKDTQVTPREEKIDLSNEVLQGLLALCRQHPDSQLLRFLAESFGYSAVRKREVEWADAFLRPLVEELNWRTPWILVAYGETLVEMLENDEAKTIAAEALAMRPDFEPALRLQAIANGELNPYLESREQHEGHNHR